MTSPDSLKLGPVIAITPDEKAACLRLLDRHDAMDLEAILFEPPKAMPINGVTCGRGHPLPVGPSARRRQCSTCAEARKDREVTA